ncbi:MAG: histidine kinase [Tenuifilaceae bacterium]|nr:histidine kinase [Tenuifilaceae bacterium]
MIVYFMCSVNWFHSCYTKCPFTALLSTVAVLTFIFVVIAVWFYRRKDKLKIIELEQRLLLSQMNPHFVFNSLTAIQSYIFRNDPYMAGKYLANFSKLVRLILENSRAEYITISKEKETVTNYLELQSLRFENKFDYEIKVSADIDLEHHLVPPMMAQPFIENAIEHGIIHLSNKGRITISYEISNESIILEVEDNGVGIEKSAEIGESKRTKHQSLATRITKERLRNLRKVHGKNIRMEIIDLASISNSTHTGTRIRFYIPIIIK